MTAVMAPPRRGVLRLVRATAWTTASLGLSSGAHLVGGGALPSPGAALVLGMALLWSGLLITRWRLGPGAMIVSLGISQVLAHVALTAAEAARVGSACAPGGGHHATLSCASEAAVSHHSSTMMLLAHAGAAVLLALLLARGEHAVWVVAGYLWPRVPTLPSPPALGRDTCVPVRRGGPPVVIPVLGGVGRRGPPRPPASSVT